MNLGLVKLKPIRTPLYGFTGGRVDTEGVIILQITMGEAPKQIMRMIDLLVVDQPSAYNAILGRPTLNDMRAVTTTYHLTMKFLISSELRVISMINPKQEHVT